MHAGAMRYTLEAAVDGEQFLKVGTEDARLASRHETARRITPLLTEAALFLSARDTTWSIPEGADQVIQLNAVHPSLTHICSAGRNHEKRGLSTPNPNRNDML
jgi:hypothetical protein